MAEHGWMHHKDLARHWNCSVRTVLRHIHAGRLPALKLGARTYMITPVDAAAFYATHRTGGLSASGASMNRGGRPWGA